ncbi:hypothetical protein P3T16_005223 [Paraburkholderia sp. GAS42]
MRFNTNDADRADAIRTGRPFPVLIVSAAVETFSPNDAYPKLKPPKQHPPSPQSF